MAATVRVEQSIREWGTDLGVRITGPVARAARLSRGTLIQVEVVEGGLFVRVCDKPKVSRAQKLKAFDPRKHGGEVMATTGRVGKEVF